MPHKFLLKLFQCSALSTALLLGLASVAHGDEDQTPASQPESAQPAQQAAPTPPTAEPQEPDRYEETALV